MSWRATSWAAEQITGSPISKLVLLKLADNANDEGVCWPSITLIAEHTELGERTVQDHLRRLEAKGLVRIERRTSGGVNLPNYYHLAIAPPARRRAVVQEPHHGDGAGAAPRVQPTQQGGAAPAGGMVRETASHIEEPPIEPPMNRHSLTPDGESETIAVLGLSDQDSWPEARSAFADTWPDGFPADGENACRIEFEKITRIRPAEIIIGCIRAHGAALVERKAKRVGMPGPFAFKQPRNWLKQGDWQGYIPAVEQATQVETEETLALARVQATLGPGVVKILKEVGVTVGEIARLEGVTFEDGPPPRFVTVRPFQAARLRQRADKLERELGEGLLIIEGPPERKSA